MAEAHRAYKIKPITVNDRIIVQVIISSHYEEKHGEHMSDDLVLKLVEQLNDRKELPEAQKGKYSYFVTLVEYKEKQFRLIWLMEDNAIYIGVVNAYRDRRSK